MVHVLTNIFTTNDRFNNLVDWIQYVVFNIILLNRCQRFINVKFEQENFEPFKGITARIFNACVAFSAHQGKIVWIAYFQNAITVFPTIDIEKIKDLKFSLIGLTLI